MNVLERMTVPEGEPAPGACVRIERPERGLAILRLAPPHRRTAVFDRPLLRDLELALAELERDTQLTALVLTGREPLDFVAGADIDAIRSLASAELATELARFGQSLFERLAHLRMRKIAAVGGPVPGGAFELSLACDAIVLADHPRSRIGLPETRLGILPGWGGCQRLPRRVGVPSALAAILSGKLYPPREARALGLVDRLCAPQDLVRIASDIAMGRERDPRRSRGARGWLVDRNPLALAVISATARKNLRAQTKGRYPAPERALDLIVRAPSTPLARGLESEARALGELAVGPVCKSLVFLFQASEAQKKLARRSDGSEARSISRAGVVGAGVMGGAIAGLFAERVGIVRLCDLSRAALDAAQVAHTARVEKARRKRIVEPYEARRSLDRLETSTAIDGLARAELILEAVAERLDVKRAVLAQVAAQVSPDAILATNTSSLSVTEIADGLPNPARVVGMHFFNPVHAMPLVEIVRGRETSDEVIAATAKLAVALGKTPIVVADVPGFLVNRVLGPYLDEAVRLLELGVPHEAIERAARDFGLPMGPLELLDEVGLDIASHAAASLAAGYGARMQSSPLAARLAAAGLRGKKGGGGFFRYAQDPRSGRPRKLDWNPAADAHLARRATMAIDAELVRDRLVLALVNEAARCLEERVVASAEELDLATVFGMGFPPFLGGALRYVRARGTAEVVTRLEELAALPDVRQRDGARERFDPAPLLRSLART